MVQTLSESWRILLANNSHADAGIAFLDPDYELISVVFNSGKRNSLSDKNLRGFFMTKTAKKVSLISMGKGIGYTKTASSYLFRRIRQP